MKMECGIVSYWRPSSVLGAEDYALEKESSFSRFCLEPGSFLTGQRILLLLIMAQH